MFEQTFVSWCFFEAIGKRVHAWREFCQPFDQPGMGCLHNRCVEVFEGKPCALHRWTRLCGQDTYLWVLSVHISGSSKQYFWHFMAMFQRFNLIDIQRFMDQSSRIHNRLISVWSFGRSPSFCCSLDFTSPACFIWFINRSSTFGSPSPWCSLVTMLCSRFRDGTWRDNKLRHLGGKRGINMKEHELVYYIYIWKQRYRTPAVFSWSNLNCIFAL